VFSPDNPARVQPPKPASRADTEPLPADTIPLDRAELTKRVEARTVPAHTTETVPHVKSNDVEPIAAVVDLKKAERSAEQPRSTEPTPAENKVAPIAENSTAAVKSKADSPDEKAPEPERSIRSFKEMIALPDDQFDLAEAILALGSEQGFELAAGAGETLKRIDKLAARAKGQLPDKADTTDYMDALYDVVLNRKPSEPTHEEKADDFDLSYAVFQHHGNCLSIGISALSVARRIGAPLNGAQCPGHFFLRGMMVIKGQEKPINFDVTRPTPDNWGKLDDEFYRKWRHFDAKAEASGEYLRPMTDKQVVSAFLSARSGFLARAARFDEALNDSERALALDSKNISALINSGFAHESLKKYDDAEASYRQALEIDPQCIRAMNNLAFVKIRDKHAQIFDPKKAEKLIDQAIKIDPDQGYLYATKGEICAVRGEYKQATHNLQVALSLSPKNAAYRERFMALREHLRRESSGDLPPSEQPATGVPTRK
jgi:regulator of sirC expression with transglutaminase-like and TPR domain